MVQEFLEAIVKDDVGGVKDMLQSNPTLLQLRIQTGQSPVLTAIYNGARATLAYLLEQDIPLDLFEAAASGRLDRVQELVDSEPNLVNAYANDGFTALGLAAYLGHKDIVEYLLEKGADVNRASKNDMKVMPLHSAVATLQVDVAELLLKHGAEVNAIQQGGWTPLHEAALHGHEEMIKLLLEFGANKTIKKDNGEIPLDVALQRNHLHVVTLLN
ncbi:ankyrin repeat domain-containing protein [Brevibacillus borstelensis]|nr:ankyrin repeat domain-containing protein [Brevibacillus borstelensis]MBE5393873.1 ankyrin repeat domain-containing protein [Brevibacillus borstelensis]WNF06403.1 ankyrin repeat domain-containing protein [Brevibacillus borstelensis]